MPRLQDADAVMFPSVYQNNVVGKAKANVAFHYDLNRALFELFLDRDLQYSCAYFSNDGGILEQAQLNKKKRVAAKLLLEPGMRVLDIGSGFGGSALHLARVHRVEVVGLTLSEHSGVFLRSGPRRPAWKTKYHSSYSTTVKKADNTTALFR